MRAWLLDSVTADFFALTHFNLLLFQKCVGGLLTPTRHIPMRSYMQNKRKIGPGLITVPCVLATLL